MTILTLQEYHALINPDNTSSTRSASRDRQRGTNREAARRGKAFEELIKLQCDIYKRDGVAVIDKIPEPFRVSRKTGNGMFEGRFTREKAQPDFQGTLQGGRSVLIEAKSTSKDRISYHALTDTQMELLEQHSSAGAMCLILCEIEDRHFVIPWEEWRDMKAGYGHLYLKPEEIEDYEIIEGGGSVLPFLEIVYSACS